MRVYLDNHATTRCDPRVVEAMLPYFSEEYGNASSAGHPFGEAARDAVEQSRASIAQAIGAQPDEVLFTSGATESNNLAIRGVADRARRRGDHLVSVQTEHHSVLAPLERLEKQGYEVTLLPVKQHGSPTAGLLDVNQFADLLRDDTLLASVMLANNEIGAIQPIAELAALCRERGVLLHCDATQAVGKLPVNVGQLGVDLMSFSAHKLYGPKGVGALYVRSRDPVVRLQPQIIGGGQQQGRRSGTLNVPGIVGFAKAVELCQQELDSEPTRLASLRGDMFARLSENAEPLELCGPATSEPATSNHGMRLPGNLNITFPGVDGEAILMRLEGVAASSGAACTSGEDRPSHVLLALGLTPDQARGSLRLGLGRFTTEEDVQRAAKEIAAAVRQLRGLG